LALPQESRNVPDHIKRQWLTQRLSSKISPRLGDEDYPPVPPEDDLIGFVTTANFNLAEGLSTAIGSLLVNKVSAFGGEKAKEEYLCIVRDSGYSTGRLARWEII
jgi:ribonuclease P/MRP protein subunit POP1